MEEEATVVPYETEKEMVRPDVGDKSLLEALAPPPKIPLKRIRPPGRGQWGIPKDGIEKANK